MSSRSLIPPPSSGFPTRRVQHRTALRRASVLALLVATGLTSACDRLKAAITGEAGAPAGDPVWQGDSTLLASNPGLLFRVVDHEAGRAVAPIAIIGQQGFRRLKLSPRGWRAFDLNYLQEGNSLDALREGRIAGTIRLTRGMWLAGGQPLDTLDKAFQGECLVPVGLANVPAGVRLAVAGVRPKLNAVTTLSAGELSAAISKVPTLIAPSVGISTSMIARYQREVHVLNTGVNARPSILITYNDPEQLPDTASAVAQRPRQFIVILDKSLYGYRPSYTFTTVGNPPQSVPRMTYLDYVDLDNDGKGEVLFGMSVKFLKGQYDGTIALRFENEAWRRVMSDYVRCPGPIRGI